MANANATATSQPQVTLKDIEINAHRVLQQTSAMVADLLQVINLLDQRLVTMSKPTPDQTPITKE
jgi:hypothetical protein